ncbi:PQQ-binding-like beta-propeller repeat protein [Paenibacillus pinihumi]|uniref:outer membrane protein assembly factor BamB family protein n=1 Tax=Paenibacillus pinihumi TaxID=669462 RepID=UPI0003FC9E08|nr:PQQ-binding-like beta-propeller repeat protein [Paenibacillus pinihumi]
MNHFRIQSRVKPRMGSKAILLLLSAALAIAGCTGESGANQSSTDNLPNAQPLDVMQIAGTTASPPKVIYTGVAHSIEGASNRQDASNNETMEETVTLGAIAPMFAEPLKEQTAKSTQIWSYWDDQLSYPTKEKQGEWLKLESSYGEVWVPSWYADEQSQAEVKLRSALRLRLADEAQLHLYPGSLLKWKAKEWLKVPHTAADDILSVLEWKDWYGIIIPPPDDYIPYENLDFVAPNRPSLLWIHKSDILSKSAVQGGIFRQATAIPTGTLKDITEVILRPGIKREQIRLLLGEADLIETSGNLNMTGLPMKLGENWRYEREDGQLVITLSKVVEHFNWTLSKPGFAFRAIPLVSSKTIKPAWRVNSTLAYNYLHAVTDQALILMGDDGGFSGMHYDSSLYAVNRTSGRKLWQIDLGYSGASTVLDRNGRHITVLYQKANQETKEWESHLRRVRVSDGKTVWQKHLKQKEYEGFNWLSGAAGAIVIYSEFHEQKGGKLTAWDAVSGKLKWSKTFDMPIRILYKGANDSYILIHQGAALQALEPGTGKLAWKLSGKEFSADQGSSTFVPPPDNPFSQPSQKKWLSVGQEQLYIDLRSGKIISRYAMQEGNYVEAINERYWLIGKPQDAKNYWDAKQIVTALYDAIAGKTLWEIKGSARGGAIDKDTVYAVLNNNLPVALRKSDGQIKWKIKSGDSRILPDGKRYSEDGLNWPGQFFIKDGILLLTCGLDVLNIDKKQGEIRYRLSDILFSYPEMMDPYTRNALIHEDDRYLYMGSANGSYIKMEKSKLRL